MASPLNYLLQQLSSWYILDGCPLQQERAGGSKEMNIARSIATRVVLSSLIAAGATMAQAQTSTWKIDPVHSEADFSVKHMGISNVHGRFGGVNGTLILDEKDLNKSTVNATIDTTTVSTGTDKRDAHLKSPDFFDVAKFPTMTFVSKSLTEQGGEKKLTGDLTLHGVTKSVTLNLEGPSKEQADPYGKTRRAFSATTTIRRQDFGLVWAGTLKSGDAVVGDDVKVELDIEVVKQ
jgi:polyisoprenoid-binding protein YceI